MGRAPAGPAETKSSFRPQAERTANHALLEPLLTQHFAAQPHAFWLQQLTAANVPCAPIATVAEVTQNPPLCERQMILHANHPAFAHLVVPGSPRKTVGAARTPDTRAPQLGEHTEEILSQLLGYQRLSWVACICARSADPARESEYPGQASFLMTGSAPGTRVGRVGHGDCAAG